MDELESSPNYNILGSICAGILAGASGVVVGHPFDSLKVRLQVGRNLKHLQFDMLTFKQLYRGILPPILSVGFIQSINFSIYEYSKLKIHDVMTSQSNVGKYLHDYYITENEDINHIKNVFTAGSISGLCICVITTPFSMIKLQQQVASEKGIVTCIKEVYLKSGFIGFYRGFGSMLVLESFGRG